MSRSKVRVTGDKKNEKVQHFVFESSSGVRSFASSTPVGKLAHAVQFCFVLFCDRNACELLFWRCDVCIQLLKVDEDQRVPSVEVSCEQIVDRLVQTALTAANGQPLSPVFSFMYVLCSHLTSILASECWQMPQWDRCPFCLESGGE